MERIQEFTRDGKNFIYIDFSEFKTNDEFLQLTGTVKQTISKYQENSLYTITSIDNIRFDSCIKDTIAEYMKQNAPYVKYGTIIGLDGIKRILANSIIKISGRTNIHLAFSKEKAIEWLLQQE